MRMDQGIKSLYYIRTFTTDEPKFTPPTSESCMVIKEEKQWITCTTKAINWDEQEDQVDQATPGLGA